MSVYWKEDGIVDIEVAICDPYLTCAAIIDDRSIPKAYNVPTPS